MSTFRIVLSLSLVSEVYNIIVMIIVMYVVN